MEPVRPVVDAAQPDVGLNGDAAADVPQTKVEPPTRPITREPHHEAQLRAGEREKRSASNACGIVVISVVVRMK